MVDQVGQVDQVAQVADVAHVDQVCDKLIGGPSRLPVHKHTFTIRGQRCKKEKHSNEEFQVTHLN